MTDLPLDTGLALLLLLLALFVLRAGGAVAAAIGFVAYGLVLGLVWVRLEAPDVAMTEMAIGAATGMLLIGAALRLRGGAEAGERPGIGMRLMAALFSMLVAAGLAVLVLALPEPAPGLAPAAIAALPASELGNPVTAVLMAYRALDTLLEKLVLLLAVIGIWSLAPGTPDLGLAMPEPEPAEPLRFLARLLPPIGLVVGVHVVWVGADHPGGAFQGGTVLAMMWVLAMMAGHARPPAPSARGLRLALVAGGACFALAGLAGFLLAGGFLAWPSGFAKPLILLVEVPVTLSIAAALGLMLLGTPLTRPTR